MTELSRVFNVQAYSPTALKNSSKLLCKCSYQLLSPSASASAKVILWIFLSFQISCKTLFCNLHSLMNFKKVIAFQFVQLFLCCVDKSDDFLTLYSFGTKTRCLLLGFLFDRHICPRGLDFQPTWFHWF